MELTPALNPLVTLADKLGMLQALRGKLIRQPDPAAQELATVLEELAKVYEAILSELSSYLSITYYEEQPPEERARQREALVKLENSAIIARIGDARGRCSKIANIYDNLLSPWFRKTLWPSETAMMEDLFEDLAKSDVAMLAASDAFALWLSQQATETLDLVDDGKLEEAKQRILRARKDVAAQRREMVSAIRTLYDLQAEFISVSGAV